MKNNMGTPFKYRDHCGSLEDSMSTEKTFYSSKELFEHFRKNPKVTAKLVEIKSGTGMFDDRINQLSVMLLARHERNISFMVYGWTDVKIEPYGETTESEFIAYSQNEKSAAIIEEIKNHQNKNQK